MLALVPRKLTQRTGHLITTKAQPDCEGVPATPWLWRSMLRESDRSTSHRTLAARRGRKASRPAGFRHGYHFVATTSTPRWVLVRQVQHRAYFRLFSLLADHPFHGRLHLVIGDEGTACLRAVRAAADKPRVACRKAIQSLGRLQQGYLSPQARLHNSLVRSQIHDQQYRTGGSSRAKVRSGSELLTQRALYGGAIIEMTPPCRTLHPFRLFSPEEETTPGVIVLLPISEAEAPEPGQEARSAPSGSPKVRLRATRIAAVA
jgi:hypothetical protein